MGFRDDNEALRQRVAALEDEVETLTEELEEARTPKVRVEPAPIPEPPLPKPASDDLASRVATREAKKARRAQRQRERELAAKRANENRPSEARVLGSGDDVRVLLKRSVGRQFRDQLPALIGVVPLSIGVLISTFSELGWLVSTALFVAFTAGTLAVNALVALLKRADMDLRFSGGNFELKQRGRTRMIGRRRDLRIYVSPPTADEGGELDIRHEGKDFTVKGLGLEDVGKLRPLAD